MKTSQRGLDLIKRFEGLRLSAYWCPAGVKTIGYGHTRGVTMGMRITKPQANEFLLDDVALAERDIDELVKVPLSQNQFDALVDFVFNLGAEEFAESTLLKKLNARDYAGAANEFSKWVYSDHVKLPGLVKRRAAERELFLS